jgi:5-carboxymethyl-2-hydroxymuconate isomerase
MPHLHIQYTTNLDEVTHMGTLCQTLAATLVALRSDDGVAPLFPEAGTRVMAYPAAHFAVGDGRPDRAYVYMNLRIKPGRTAAMKQRAGEAVFAAAQAHLAHAFEQHAIGLTVQVDEGIDVYEGRQNNLAEHIAAHRAAPVAATV